jgi:sec-independent protein translocase protein TatC
MEEEKLSIIDHLEELRRRLLICIFCVFVLFPVGFAVSKPSIDWLVATFCEGLELHTFAIHELFFLRMKIGFAMAVVGAFPVLAWQAWRFIAPGLYEHERGYVSRFVFTSSFLFLTGASFALFVVYPTVLRFFMSMQTEHIKSTWGVGNFVGMASMLMLGFGFMFQLPIAVYLLAVTELVSLDTMRKARPIVVIVLLVLSAILTPPDVVSQLMMGVPAWFLFEVSLIVSQRSVTRRVAERKRREEEERLREEEEERREREERAAYLAAHPEEAEAEQAEAEEDDAEEETDYSEYYDEFYDESYNYADYQEKPKKKPGKWQVRGLRRDRRFMRDALGSAPRRSASSRVRPVAS